jgi:hypothetical protein
MEGRPGSGPATSSMEGLPRPPPCMTTPEKGGASRLTDETFLEPPDPNLCCPICCQPFTRPMRTGCGCAAHLSALPQPTRTRAGSGKARDAARHPRLCVLTPSSPRRHIFCDACVQTWLPLKPECPECRAPLRADELSPDRLADRLISNLDTFCQMRKAGCQWVGKRGAMNSHQARECPCVPVVCPNAGCVAEMPRSELDECARRPIPRQRLHPSYPRAPPLS